MVFSATVISRLFSTENLLYFSLPTTLQVPVQEHLSELGWVQPTVIIEYSAVEYHPLNVHVARHLTSPHIHRTWIAVSTQL